MWAFVIVFFRPNCPLLQCEAEHNWIIDLRTHPFLSCLYDQETKPKKGSYYAEVHHCPINIQYKGLSTRGLQALNFIALCRGLAVVVEVGKA